jgi:hypothetical protein
MSSSERIPVIKAKLQRQLAERKNKVCSGPEFPGGPAGYKYYPERCVPKEKKNKPLTKMAVEKQKINDIVHKTESELKNIDWKSDIEKISKMTPGKTLTKAQYTQNKLLLYLNWMPQFIKDAKSFMTNKTNITNFPDTNKRYDNFYSIWRDGYFKSIAKQNNVKLVVFEWALSQIKK